MSGTTLDILCSQAEEISRLGSQLIREFSGMHPRNTPDSPVVIISPRGNYYWNELPAEGKKLQTQLLAKIDRYSELILTLTHSIPTRFRKTLERRLKEIRNAVDQRDPTWWKTKDEAVQSYRKLANEVITTLQDHYGNSSNTVLVLPDTNALLHNPDIEDWKFEGMSPFTIILTPTVLSELDEFKNRYRKKGVQDKASKIINKIKEYRRRGSLLEGVPIVKNHSYIHAIATEPKMSETLSWLDSSNSDDRFLATTIEVMRSSMGARIIIVTRDINLQNKAELAGIPVYDVPPQMKNGKLRQ